MPEDTRHTARFPIVAQADLPAIGSIWQANDGRRMRVEEWVQPLTYPQDNWWAKVTVLNPAFRQRKTTTMSLQFFGTFLMPQEATDAA